MADNGEGTGVPCANIGCSEEGAKWCGGCGEVSGRDGGGAHNDIVS
jgi:hypothetical protein